MINYVKEDQAYQDGHLMVQKDKVKVIITFLRHVINSFRTIITMFDEDESTILQ